MAYSVAAILAAYAAAGLIFAVAFVTLGAQRLDSNVEGAPWTFRVLIAPGAAALWPLLLWQWVRQRGES